MQAVWDQLFGGKFKFIDTDSVKWDRSPTGGYAARASLPSPGGKSTPATPAQIAWFEVEGRLGGPGANGGNDYVLAIQITATTMLTSPLIQNPIPTVSGFTGNTIAVAKQINLRRSISAEIYDSVKYTYKSPTGGDVDNQRISTDANNNSQNEEAYPRYVTSSEVRNAGLTINGVIPDYAQCYILCAKIPSPAGSGVFTKNADGTFTQIEWVEIGPPRVWVSTT